MWTRTWVTALLVILLASACNTVEHGDELGVQRAAQCEASWTYTGDVVVTPDNLNDYGALTAIEGDLIVHDTDLRVLHGFPCLRSVSESIQITDNDALRRLAGFSSLHSAGGVDVSGNPNLRTIGGFDRLDALPGLGGFVIRDNPSLVRIQGFASLRETGGDVSSPGFDVVNNDALRVLTGFNSLEAVHAAFRIVDNDALTRIDGFRLLGRVVWDFEMHDNPALERVKGFDSLRYAAPASQAFFVLGGESLVEIPTFAKLEVAGGGGFAIRDTQLVDIDGFPVLELIGADFGLSIHGNPVLADISGFPVLRDVVGGFSIEDNAGLEHITGFEALNAVPFGDFSIHDNGELLTIDSFYELTTVESELTLDDVKILCPSFQKLTSGVGESITFNGSEATLPLPCVDAG